MLLCSTIRKKRIDTGFEKPWNGGGGFVGKHLNYNQIYACHGGNLTP
jgi:hypothetical protein